MKTLIIILVLLTATVQAAEVGVITGSGHTDGQQYNEDTPGVYIHVDKYVIGTFKNSYHDTATFAGTTNTIHLAVYKHYKVSWETTFGLMYGYGVYDGRLADASQYGKSLVVFASPAVKISSKHYSVRLHTMGNAVATSVSYWY